VDATSYQSGKRWQPPPINQANGGSHLKRWQPPPINQANGGSHLLSIRQTVAATSQQSSEYGHPIQKGRSSPYPSTVSQELRMDEEVTKAEPTCRS